MRKLILYNWNRVVTSCLWAAFRTPTHPRGLISAPRQIKTTQNKVKIKNYLPWTEHMRHRK